MNSICSAQIDDILERAWHEYQFQAYRNAILLFDEALALNPSNLTAKLGLAMISQFDESNTDLNKAISSYKEILSANPDTDISMLANTFLAECLYEKGDLKAANILWENVQKENPESIIAQDALLRKTVANIEVLESKETEALNPPLIL